MLEIKALGGSGEDSRNCFLVSWDDHSILLDCGVRREIADVSTVYPLLTEEIARDLDAVFLSHAHEDHTAALPYLYHLGYKGKVYATRETISSTPGFLKKWHDYAKSNDAVIPFDEEDINKVIFEDINNAPDYLISRGRSGHMLGSQWYLFNASGRKVLYTGDFTYDGLLLQTDELPECDILIMDCAYASRKVDQRKNYEKLARLAEKTLKNKGHLLLPVPANGRGIDMYLYLEKLGHNMIVDSSVINNAHKLKEQTAWIRDTDLWKENNEHTSIITGEIIKPAEPSVIIVPDGMMTTARSISYFELLRDEPNSLVVITGHSAKGTLANSIQDDDYCQENGIKVRVENLTIKVHPDEKDVVDTVKKAHPEAVMLFHARQEKCGRLKRKLVCQKVDIACSLDETITEK